MSKYWVITSVPQRVSAGIGNKIQDIPANVVLDVLDTVEIMYFGDLTVWYKTNYKDKVGWSYSGCFEVYEEVFPNEVLINHPSPNVYDAAQYLVYEGRTKYNQCGEICCAYIVKSDIDSLLDLWKQQSPSFYERIYKGTNDKGTGLYDLNNLMGVYGYDNIPRLEVLLKEPVTNRVMMTPRRLDELCKDYQIIIGVRISNTTGRLQQTGVNHWVVVEEVFANGVNSGFVTLYNPFPNRKQVYSWNEFIISVGSPTGICLKRK